VKMQEIADGIKAHLKRFADDPVLCKHQASGRAAFWNTNAVYPGGVKVRVMYISYQGSTTLSKEQAAAYLDWLNAGNVGTHYAAQRDEGGE